MINWPAIKEAALPKGYTGGKIHWNHWIGEYRAHPSDNDLERLSKLPKSKYERMRDLIADNDQWAREDAALRRSMHWRPLNYIPLPEIAVPFVAMADAKKSEELVGDPEYESARKLMHQTVPLDPVRVAKYRKKIDSLVADLRAKAAKTASEVDWEDVRQGLNEALGARDDVAEYVSDPSMPTKHVVPYAKQVLKWHPDVDPQGRLEMYFNKKGRPLGYNFADESGIHTDAKDKEILKARIVARLSKMDPRLQAVLKQP